MKSIRKQWQISSTECDFFPSNRPFVINNMFDELWSEINDMPGEIFDIPEMKDLQEDDNKSLEDFLKTNNDF